MPGQYFFTDYFYFMLSMPYLDCVDRTTVSAENKVTWRKTVFGKQIFLFLAQTNLHANYVVTGPQTQQPGPVVCMPCL